MNPISAFQVLVLAMAAAMAVEAVKPTYARGSRIAFLAIFTALAAIGLATNNIAAAFPATSSFMAWVGSSPIALFAVFLAWIVLLQRPWRRPSEPLPPVLDPTELSQVREDLAALKAELDRFSLAANDTIESMQAAHEKLDGLVDTVIKLHSERFDKVEKAYSVLDTKVSRMVDDYQRTLAFEDDARAQLTTLNDETRKARNSLYAIYTREDLTKIARDIEMDAARLNDGPRAGETFDELGWTEWEAIYGRGESALNVWIENGRFFAPNVKVRINSINDRLYSQCWDIKDSQFPNTETLSRSEAVRRYKKFRILYQQWQTVRQEVDQGIFQVAYVGLTEEEVRQRPPKVQS